MLFSMFVTAYVGLFILMLLVFGFVLHVHDAFVCRRYVPAG